MPTWDSWQYLKFAAERTRPASDLAAAIPMSEPRLIADIGCGPGNSTRVLKSRFPRARVIGFDSSPEMIEAAKRADTDTEFCLLRVPEELSRAGSGFDVVFSNACLQWIPDHAELLPRLMELLSDGGTLAVQIPINFDQPIHQIIEQAAQSERWREKAGQRRLFYTLKPEEYFDILSDISDDFGMWQTTYFHRMPDHEHIIEWYKGTGLRPYLEALGEADAAAFEREIFEEVKKRYPTQKNGEVIFRFPRLFFTAKKTGGSK